MFCQLQLQLWSAGSINTPEPVDPCQPSPCGPNADCRVLEQRPVCTCYPGYYGAPPACRPECVINSECAPSLACINLQCGDPCAGVCGLGALCDVVNHNPICSCPEGFIGDPFSSCRRRPGEYSLSSKIFFVLIHNPWSLATLSVVVFN